MASLIGINQSESIGRILARCIDWLLYVVIGIWLWMSSLIWGMSSLIWVTGFTRTYVGLGGGDSVPSQSYRLWFETYAVPDFQPWLSIFAIHLACVILLLVPSLLYELPMTAARGQTIGKIMMGIKVTHNSNGRVPGWKRSSVRWAIIYLPLLVPIIGIIIFLLTVISPLFDPQRRGWHDKIAGTIVTQASKTPAIQDNVSLSVPTHKRFLSRTIDWLLYSIAGITLVIWSIGLLELEGSTFIDIYKGIAFIEPFQITVQSLLPESDLWIAISILHIGFVAVLASVVIYELPLIALRGETIGKILTQTRVVCIGNGRVPGWKRASIRWIVIYLPLLALPIIGILIFFLTAASPLFDSQRRGWHDKAAGAIVVPTSDAHRGGP